MNAAYNEELQTYLRELQGFVPSETMTDEAAEALACIWTTVYGMVVGDGLDDVFGDRKTYAEMLDRLCGVCHSQSEEGGRMTWAMYRLLHAPLRLTDAAETAACDRQLAALLASEPADVHALLDRAETAFFMADRMPDENEERQLRQCVSLVGEQLLAFTHPDRCETSVLTAADVRALYQLYELTRWGAGLSESEASHLRAAARIADFARETLSRQAEADPLVRLWLLAIAVDHVCHKIDAAVQNEYFACGA